MDLELFEDSLGKTCPKDARVGSKFRPKAKPALVKKNSQTPISSEVVNARSDHLCGAENVSADSRVALDSVVDSFGNDNCHSGFENRVIKSADIVTCPEALDDSSCDPSTILGNPVPSTGLLDGHVSSNGDLDFFQDIYGETSTKNVRAGSKFRHKSKPQQVKKNLQKPTSSDVVNAESDNLLSIGNVNEGSSVALDLVYDGFRNDHQQSGFGNHRLGSADIFIGLGSLGDSVSYEATVLGNPVSSSESPNDHISGSKDAEHRPVNLVYPAVDDDPAGISDSHIHDHVNWKQRKAIDDHELFDISEEVLEDRNVPADCHRNSDDVSVDEFQVENDLQKENLQNESMKPTVKRKKDTESSDQAGKKPRKKFSHTTWRRRKKGETSDDEIRCQKMPLREGKANEEAETSLMGKTPRYAWSESDTELFYQAFCTLKTDFAMIQQSFFPSKTCNQIKAKYKKENRKHPVRIHEAETSQTKDESMLWLLKQIASKVKQNTTRADSVSLSGECEMEEEFPQAADAHVGEAEKFGQMEDLVMSEITKADDVPETQSMEETSDDNFLYQYKSALTSNRR